VATDSEGVPTITNAAMQKIADDVLAAAKYSMTIVAGQDNLEATEYRQGSMEKAFQEALLTLKPEKLQSLQATAREMLATNAEQRQVLFGRYGQLESADFLATGGFERVHEALPQLDVSREMLGISVPGVSVPLSALRPVRDGLLLPTTEVPAGGEIPEFEDAQTQAEQSYRETAQAGIANEDRLNDLWGPVYHGDPFADELGDEFEGQAVTDKLGFYVSRVKCVDETNPETFLWVNLCDTIDMGSVTVDEDGDTKRIGPQRIGKFCQDGVQKTYSPNWRYTWFNMREHGDVWPKRYVVNIFLAEIDNGGFASMLQNVWALVRDRVRRAIAEAVAGVLTELVGPAIARAIGEAVAWIVDKLVGWLISLFKDDVFRPAILRCTVPSYSARWYYPNGTWGNPRSNTRRAYFNGFGGQYYVEYYWKLYS
jgi:hypothetical protein